MSQVTHPRISLPTQVRPTRTLWVGALLALVAAIAVVAILALGNESTDNTTVGAQPISRSGGGPVESNVAAAIGSRPAVSPDEAGIAASIATPAAEPATGPDESRTAAAVADSSSPGPTGPDESRTAASISGR